MRSLLSHALLAMTLILAPVSTLAQADEIYERIEQMHGNAQDFDIAFRNLVQAMRHGDGASVAGLAEYPLTVNANGETYDIQNAADFEENFDVLVMPETQRAVSRQTYDELFVNSDGVMLADGAVWMGAICEDETCENAHWAIISINN